MGPEEKEEDLAGELFRNRLENMIDQRHELVRLAHAIDWSVFEEQWGQLFENKAGAPAIATRMRNVSTSYGQFS